MIFIKVYCGIVAITQFLLLTINAFFIQAAENNPSLFYWIPRRTPCQEVCRNVEPGGLLVYYMEARDLLEKSTTIFLLSFFYFFIISIVCSVVGYLLVYKHKDNPETKKVKLVFANNSVKFALFFVVAIILHFIISAGLLKCIYVLGCQY